MNEEILKHETFGAQENLDTVLNALSAAGGVSGVVAGGKALVEKIKNSKDNKK